MEIKTFEIYAPVRNTINKALGVVVKVTGDNITVQPQAGERMTFKAQYLAPANEAEAAALQPLIADEDGAQREAERFRALGDPSRLRILSALSLAELCVCDLSGLLGISQTATSQHLKILRTAGMVRYRKQGRMAFYRLADPTLAVWLARLRPAPAGEAGAGGRQSG